MSAINKWIGSYFGSSSQIPFRFSLVRAVVVLLPSCDKFDNYSLQLKNWFSAASQEYLKSNNGKSIAVFVRYVLFLGELQRRMVVPFTLLWTKGRSMEIITLTTWPKIDVAWCRTSSRTDSRFNLYLYLMFQNFQHSSSAPHLKKIYLLFDRSYLVLV